MILYSPKIFSYYTVSFYYFINGFYIVYLIYSSYLYILQYLSLTSPKFYTPIVCKNSPNYLCMIYSSRWR